MHFHPFYATQIGELAEQFPDMTVILDHLGRAGEGTPADFANVLKLAKFPRVIMKYSGVNYSSKQKYPYADVKPIVRRIYDAFGPNRLVWGYFGHDLPQFKLEAELLDTMFDYAPEAERRKIRGLNAMRIFGW
jgi:L-fuconolactonase